MELATALAISQFSDQCIKYDVLLPNLLQKLAPLYSDQQSYGQKLVRRCQSYRHAEAEAQELMISIEHNWMKTEAQINFLKKISNTLDPCYRDVQSRVLSELEGKLKTATLTMDQLVTFEKEKKKRKRRI